MTISNNEFYECDNPGCRLRFPGSDGYPRWKRCPACRSNIHLVAKEENKVGRKDSTGIRRGWHLEALLDNIRSAWNVGSIFRTSDGVGVKKLYLCGITATPDNSKVGKTSLGAENTVLWEKINNGVDCARLLKSKGRIIWALEDVPEAQPLFTLDSAQENSPIVLAVGNEVSGVDPGIIELCDRVISIPMLGEKQSYNVAVAFGIAASFLLYHHRVSQESDIILPRT
jgi:23S rRNA (guanosine2251-2'-O)-methyltransferase